VDSSIVPPVVIPYSAEPDGHSTVGSNSCDRSVHKKSNSVCSSSVVKCEGIATIMSEVDVDSYDSSLLAMSTDTGGGSSSACNATTSKRKI